MTTQLAQESKKLHIPKQKGETIIKKNRDLRIQIKSLLKDGASGPAYKTDPAKTNQTKRELIKQKNFLMEENDSLLFKFKKLFLF